MSQRKVGDKVELYITQYEDVFEQTGEETLHFMRGTVKKTTKTYLIVENELDKKLHFISLAKYTIRP